MSKKIVRGITNVKNISKQSFDTNNVNDLLSDGEHSYIHRKKKDNSEEYHCLTDNVKKVESTNTSLLKVVNSTSTNTVKLTPLWTEGQTYAPGDGILIQNGVIIGNYATRHIEGLDLDTLKHGVVRSNTFTNAPETEAWFYVTCYSEGEYSVQKAIRQPINDTKYKEFIRYKNTAGWSQWIETTPASIPATTEEIEE